MIKNKRKFGDLFYNNRFLLIFSVLAAIVIWTIVAVEFSPETQVTIKNVPIKVVSAGAKGASQLEPFGAENLTADVTIVGKRYIVEDDAIINDIEVVANTGYVNSAGVQKLSVDVGSVSTRPQYEIVSCSVSEIEVLFDYYIENEVPVEPEISIEKGNLAADGFFAAELSPSSDKVTVHGPKSEVDLINRVGAVAVIEGNFSETTGFDASLSLVMTNGATPKYAAIKPAAGKTEAESIYVNAYIYKEGEAEATIGFVNVPVGYSDGKYPFTYTVEPETAVFGFKNNVKDKVQIAEISFDNIQFDENGIYKKQVTFISNNEGEVVRDDNTKMAGSKDFTVTIKKKDTTYKRILLPNKDNEYFIESVGSKYDFNYVVSGPVDCEYVDINGPESIVAGIGNNVLRLDLSGVSEDTIGKIAVPVVLESSYRDRCWITSGSANSKDLPQVYIEIK